MRIPYVSNPPKFEDPEHQAWADELVKSRGSYGLSVLDLTVMHSPAYARGFMQFFGAVRWKTTLPADVHELAMCRVGALNGAAFEWMHHAPLLRKAGVSREGVETVRTAPVGGEEKDGEGGLSARLWVVMRYVDDMTKSIQVRDEVFEEIKCLFNNQQIVELSKSPITTSLRRVLPLILISSFSSYNCRL
jgi:alkylhydroperoxidase family enzyme